VIFPQGTPEPELAWGLFDGFEGHGYAQEAALAARDHARTAIGLGPLASFIEPENTRSIALAKRLGAWFGGVFEEDGKTLHIYRHPMPEAQ
jgi:RimJ/RimL family protein N-acetyltransferase